MTHYQTLGIGPTATPAEIKAAWHHARTTLHPDRPRGNAEAFRRAADAHEILADPVKRSQYDRQLAAPVPDGDQIAEEVIRETAPQAAEQFKHMRDAAQGGRYGDLALSTLGLGLVILGGVERAKQRRKP